MELEFFESSKGNGNMVALIEGGVITAKAGISPERAAQMLETGEQVRAVEGTYEGEPTLNYLVGFGSTGTVVTLKGIKSAKPGSNRPKVAPEWI